MISQVSNKEMVAKAYLAGVDFSSTSPSTSLRFARSSLNVRRQLENERDLHTIQSVFAEKAARWDGAAAWKPSASGSRPP